MLKRVLHYLGILFALGVFAAAVWVLQHTLRDLRWEDLLHQLSEIPLANVGLSLMFTAAAYLVLTVYDRSEEHTSELQSLMRISYAVFCLKKKTHNQHEYE